MPANVSPLGARKQLLVAASELNRAQVSEDWQTMTHGVVDLGHRAKTIAAWASSAALLAAGVVAWRRGPPSPGTAKSPWFQKILNGARLAATIWFTFRARGEKKTTRVGLAMGLAGSGQYWFSRSNAPGGTPNSARTVFR